MIQLPLNLLPSKTKTQHHVAAFSTFGKDNLNTSNPTFSNAKSSRLKTSNYSSLFNSGREGCHLLAERSQLRPSSILTPIKSASN